MKKALLACLVLALSPLFLRAQIANNTSLVGTISDSSGGVISGSKVTAVEENTKVQSVAVTNAVGYYAITFIQPGTYDITAEQSGFRTVTKTGVVVPIDQAIRTDFALPVGSVQNVVTVTANTTPLSTDDATLGETFNTRAVEDLPISGHNALEIASLASNVYIGSATNYQGNPPGEDFIGAGQREIQNALSLDGVSIVNNLITTTPDHPSADMISKRRCRVATTQRSTAHTSESTSTWSARAAQTIFTARSTTMSRTPP